MTVNILFTTPGRGAWPRPTAKNQWPTGGTLNNDGDGPGPYFRSATGDMEPIGLEVAKKNRSTLTHDVHINDYATWAGGMEIQREINRQEDAGLVVDGIWGPKTDDAFRAFQEKKGIRVDGVFGPQTSRTLFEPLLETRVQNTPGFMRHHVPMLLDLCRATIDIESGWSPACVGMTTPNDLGISQINTKAHAIPYRDALTPRVAFDWKMKIILNNFDYALADIPLAIASYNVGAGGAERWHNEGRPDTWAAANYLRAIASRVTDQTLKDALAPWS